MDTILGGFFSVFFAHYLHIEEHLLFLTICLRFLISHFLHLAGFSGNIPKYHFDFTFFSKYFENNSFANCSRIFLQQFPKKVKKL